MILVLMGTQVHKFTRLLDYINDLSNEGILKEEIIVQLGTNKYIFSDENIKTYDYIPDYDSVVQKADLIICQGGVGIIMNGLEEGKKIIAVPRKKELEEHVDNHQEEICKKFNDQNYLLMCQDYEQLKEGISNIKEQEFKKYVSNTKNFNRKLNELIEKLT